MHKNIVYDYGVDITCPFSSVYSHSLAQLYSDLASMSPSWSWPWHFVSVSEFEKKQRRELLDLRGYIAQCSVLVVILAIRVYRSYHAKHAGNGVRQPWPRGRQQSWWDQALFSRGTETRRQYVVCSLWLGWLLGLSAWRTGDGKRAIPLILLQFPARVG